MVRIGKHNFLQAATGKAAAAEALQRRRFTAAEPGKVPPEGCFPSAAHKDAPRSAALSLLRLKPDPCGERMRFIYSS